MENPTNIVRSWNLQSSFQSGPIDDDRLLPSTFTRIRTNHVNTWRTEAVSPQLDWGSQRFSIYLPESLRILKDCFLKIELPALGGGAKYKKFPGLYAIKELRFMSAGQEAYVCRYADFLVDHCGTLNEEKLRVFSQLYLGTDYAGDVVTMTGEAREVLLPILLPNSTYMQRSTGYFHRGNGVFPAYTGANRIEIQVTLNSAKHMTDDADNAPASISGECVILYNEIQVPENKFTTYSDSRGNYSQMTRRLTPLNEFKHYNVANTVHKETLYQPQGTVSEIMLIAVPHQASDDLRSCKDYILPTSFRVIADSIVQRDLDDHTKVKAELYANGFTPPIEFPSCGRLCFAAHCGTSANRYTGGYVMTLSSNITFEFSFAEACDYRLVAVQYQRITMDGNGVLRSFIE